MNVLRSIAEVRAEPRHGVVGLVPTMGALHGGHEALFAAARAECDTVVASLFVNPAQFGEAADLAAYPRDEARDAAFAEAAGVDVLFAPAVRLAWLATPSWAFGFEHYAELGPWNDFVALEEQAQELFAVADRTSDAFDANFGVGHGFTGSSNDWTVKGILSWSF